MKTLFAAAFAIGLASAVSAGEPEHILGVTTDMEGVTYQVKSGGCTDKSDFSISLLESSPMQLRLVREVVDTCEAVLPYGTTINFSWEELHLPSGSEFFFTNPLAMVRVVRPNN